MAGRSDAQREAYKEAMAQQSANRSLAEQQREFDVQQANTTRTTDANLRAAGIDPSTGQPFTFTAPKGLAAPKDTSKPESFVDYYLKLADAAVQQNRPDLATTYTNLATQYGLGAERAALAGYHGAQQQEITQGKIPEEQARAQYYRQRLGVDLQKAQMALQAAQGHDRAKIEAAQTAAGAALQRAGISAQAQLEGRVLAGWYALQGRSMQDATTLAVANARDASQYAAAEGKVTGQFAPFTPAQQPEYQPINIGGPPININFSTGGGVPGMPPGYKVPSLPPPTPAAKPPAKPAAKKPEGIDQKLVAQTADIVRQQRASGKSDADIRQMMEQAGVPEPQIQAALKAAGPAQTGAAAPMPSIPIGGWYLH